MKNHIFLKLPFLQSMNGYDKILPPTRWKSTPYRITQPIIISIIKTIFIQNSFVWKLISNEKALELLEYCLQEGELEICALFDDGTESMIEEGITQAKFYIDEGYDPQFAIAVGHIKLVENESEDESIDISG